MDPTETELLIRRAQQRDSAATDALFAQYAPLVRRGLRRLLGERYRRQLGDSEDATQDALVAAFQSLPRYVHQGGGSFLAWLLCIAEREALRRLRIDAADKRGGAAVDKHLDSIDGVEPGTADPTPSQIAMGRETEERVRRALDDLPQAERDVILLKRYIGLDTAAIQLHLALPTPGAVRALLSRAQTRLADKLSAR